MAKPKSKAAPKPKQSDLFQANVRLDPKLVETIKHFAAWHGQRTFNSEVEWALQVHAATSMTVALNEPEFVGALVDANPDLDVDALKRETEESVKRLQKLAYSRPPERQFDDVMARMAK